MAIYLGLKNILYNIAMEYAGDEMLTSLREVGKSKQECYTIVQEVVVTTSIERKQNAEVLTPLTLVKEMMSKIPASAWTDLSTGWLPKIFDPCVGKGAFVVVIYDILFKLNALKELIPDEEERRCVILEDMLYFADINPFNIFVTKMILDPTNKYKLNAFTGDTLQMNIKEAWGFDIFSIIVGNPPYTTSQSIHSRVSTPMYNLFIEKYIDMTIHLVFVIPSRWFVTGKGLLNFRKSIQNRKDIESITHVDDSSKWFEGTDIKGGCCIIHKNYLYKGLCTFNNRLIDISLYDIIMLPEHHIIVSAIKFKSALSSIFTGRYFNISTNVKHKKNNDGTKTYVSKKQKNDRVVYVDKKLDNKDKFWKVVSPTAVGKARCGFGELFLLDKETAHSDSYVSFKVGSKEEGLSLISYLKTKLSSYLLSTRKVSQTISKDTCLWIPIVPFDRTWDDQKVYAYFNLTEDEIQLIKNTVS